ncbi:MAG TPA: cardiolipin synthase [Gemmataceae bacterium]|jgi:cardiolipin synthase|nr:cardiolipin synthase [Gemmataceae bacterium]
MFFWQTIYRNWPLISSILFVAHVLLSVLTICWVLALKREPMSAMAWCLTVLLMPFLGPFLFYVFGYQRVYRPLKRKQQHKRAFRRHRIRKKSPEQTGVDHLPAGWTAMARLARQLDAFAPTFGNKVEFYHEGGPAFAAKLDAIRAARHHIHLEYFIFQPDESGHMFLNALCEKARQGVQVRLVYDAMGSHRMRNRFLQPLRQAGGKCQAFFPLNLFRRHTQVNLRNHRKILVVDGLIGFTGGLNIGDEYLGKVPRFGYWRDAHLRVEGPAVSDLQRIFVEDWDFAAGELLKGLEYFPKCRRGGTTPIQVIQSGPDQQLKSIREVYFAAILRARKRLWIASPYFVPDAGILDALTLAGHTGVDVRLLGLQHPDKWLPFLAGRYYWTDMLEAGVRVYQYAKGMMHSKLVLVDGQWASIGTANLDNRSLHLNFEVNCLLYDAAAVAQLEAAFLRDLEDSQQLDPETYRKRPLSTRLPENLCRLLSPIL